MGYPSLEEIARELTRAFQALLGTDADAEFGGKRAIEVASPSGAPTREVQDKPKLSITGPELQLVEMTRKPRGMRVMTGNDPTTLSYRDTPYPQFYDLMFDVTGWAMRQTSLPGGQKGLLWLLNKVTPFMEGNRLKGADWSADEEDWPGYYFEHKDEPKMIPGLAADLFAFKGTLRIRSVRVTDGVDSGGPTIGSIDFEVGVLDNLDVVIDGGDATPEDGGGADVLDPPVLPWNPFGWLPVFPSSIDGGQAVQAPAFFAPPHMPTP